MNIKLHTPSSLKAGSGMSSMKQFLLSLLATTVSIALTFGTAAIIDYKKKQSEKREIVMMVMYDMSNSLECVENGDSMILNAMNLQRQLANDTTKFKDLWVEIAVSIPSAYFTETTERIFSSSIETINTVGNVLFTENVADFYHIRHNYKTLVCDSISKDLVQKMSFDNARGILNFDYFSFAMMSGAFLLDMRQLFDQCKQMMDVSEEDLDAYRKEREKIDQGSPDERGQKESKMKKLKQLHDDIEKAKEKLNLK